MYVDIGIDIDLSLKYTDWSYYFKLLYSTSGKFFVNIWLIDDFTTYSDISHSLVPLTYWRSKYVQ